MTTLELVRTEIKSWERDFAARHGRDPTVQDIRDHPLIAEKYKLYKKLSKHLPKPRPLDPVPPLPGFNPFSPTKKQKARIIAATKSTTPVSRARKRLRGEPVSPSPSKPKRQRIRSQALPSFPNLDQDSSHSEHEADQELLRCDFTSPFVADSPVKAPVGGKSFKLLFDDVLPALSIPKKPLGSSVPSPSASSSRTSAESPVTTFRKLHRDLTSKGVISVPEHRTNRKIFPTKDHSQTIVSAASQPRSSVKRALDTSDLAHDHTQLGAPSQPRYPLIPPSPPPQDSINRDAGKAKVKTMASRKKSRVEEEESDEGADSPDDIMFKVVTIYSDRDKRAHRHADDFDWDPSLRFGTPNHDLAANPQIDANRHAPGTLSVDLPDKFRRVLAISPSRSQNCTEERVVRGLLYGDRVGYYDPSRGGLIWDAGESVDAAYEDVETEDDWEGEPVPWDVAEL